MKLCAAAQFLQPPVHEACVVPNGDGESIKELAKERFSAGSKFSQRTLWVGRNQMSYRLRCHPGKRFTARTVGNKVNADTLATVQVQTRPRLNLTT